MRETLDSIHDGTFKLEDREGKLRQPDANIIAEVLGAVRWMVLELGMEFEKGPSIPEIEVKHGEGVAKVLGKMQEAVSRDDIAHLNRYQLGGQDTLLEALATKLGDDVREMVLRGRIKL